MNSALAAGDTVYAHRSNRYQPDDFETGQVKRVTPSGQVLAVLRGEEVRFDKRGYQMGVERGNWISSPTWQIVSKTEHDERYERQASYRAMFKMSAVLGKLSEKSAAIYRDAFKEGYRSRFLTAKERDALRALLTEADDAIVAASRENSPTPAGSDEDGARK